MHLAALIKSFYIFASWLTRTECIQSLWIHCGGTVVNKEVGSPRNLQSSEEDRC